MDFFVFISGRFFTLSMNLSTGPDLEDHEIHSLIESVILNKNPNLTDLLQSTKKGNVQTISKIVMELTLLRGHSDMGFTVS